MLSWRKRSEPNAPLTGTTGRPELSVIVVFYDMAREARRTIKSLLPPYQRDISESNIEIIAIDNGSDVPLGDAYFAEFGDVVRHIRHDTDSASPVDALNMGSDLARGEYVGFIIDGARMASPGLLASTIRATRTYDDVLVGTLAWHLGPKPQRFSMLEGYDQKREDELLAGIDWINNGYGLFEISCLAPSSADGYVNGLPHECSYVALSKNALTRLGGYDARFQTPGGGLVSVDFMRRALELGDLQPVMLLGEGTFHQFHGGIATNAPPDKRPLELYHLEYEHLVGKRYAGLPANEPVYFGQVRKELRRFMWQRA
ncbi:MAG: glycosyltransferase family A protein [Pseudomonadota bacterium]